jgi:opacity protein-like surface antigen
MRLFGLAVAALAANVAAASQAFAENGFEGAYAGAEIGYAERELTALESAISIPEDPTDFIGVGVDGEEFTYGGFVGWGAMVSDYIYLGAELGVGAGGDEVVHDINQDLSLAIEAQWRFSAAARLGVLLGDASLAYAKVGYETREYELTTSEGFVTSDDVGGLLYAVGFERLIGERVSVRGEVAHVSVNADDSEFELGLGGCAGPNPGTCDIFPVGLALEPEETRATLGFAVRF